jgi:hypothetical protein
MLHRVTDDHTLRPELREHRGEIGTIRRSILARIRTRPHGSIFLGALFVPLVVVPAMMSLARGDGTVCFSDSACPLSAINPCVRHPSFAVVGRYAFAFR